MKNMSRNNLKLSQFKSTEHCCTCHHQHTRKFECDLGQILHDELHWLDVPNWVFFKLAVTVHQCLNGRTPPYLSDYSVPVASADTRLHLHSAIRQHWQYLATGSTLMAVVPFQSQTQHSGTLSQILSETQLSVQIVSDVCLQRISSLNISAFSMSEVVDDNGAISTYLLAICRHNGCTVASGVVVVSVVFFGDCNRSQMRTGKCACLIFGVSIGFDPG